MTANDFNSAYGWLQAGTGAWTMGGLGAANTTNAAYLLQQAGVPQPQIGQQQYNNLIYQAEYRAHEETDPVAWLRRRVKEVLWT